MIETLDIPEESKGIIVSDEIVELSWTRRWVMVAVRILLTSYIGLYDFLNAPEAQWMRIIRAIKSNGSFIGQQKFKFQNDMLTLHFPK